MEPNFQTSFIPKKPMVAERAVSRRSVGIFAVISIFILFTVLLVSLALFFYKGVLTKNIADMLNQLNVAKNRFEPSKITELQVLDKRLQASTEILGKHIAVTPIFQALADITMKTVRFTNFSYDLGTDKDAKVTIKMNGLAVGYRSVALQSDLFAQNKNFINPVFSNLTLDDKGNVIFDLEFSVDPSFVNYKQMLGAESPA
jgi:hypothetical protein